jgi:aryl-alcohol dehydrogenase-like predicted oxidoreductase
MLRHTYTTTTSTIHEQGSSLGSVFRDTDRQESIETVRHAIKHGINLVDTAPWYGHGKAEEVLGEALKGVPREAYILTTKVGRYLPDPMETFDFSAERVTKSVDESLARLGLDYIDIIQVRRPSLRVSHRTIHCCTRPRCCLHDIRCLVLSKNDVCYWLLL